MHTFRDLLRHAEWRSPNLEDKWMSYSFSKAPSRALASIPKSALSSASYHFSPVIRNAAAPSSCLQSLRRNYKGVSPSIASPLDFFDGNCSDVNGAEASRLPRLRPIGTQRNGMVGKAAIPPSCAALCVNSQSQRLPCYQARQPVTWIHSRNS